jgi:hypothetical protein
MYSANAPALRYSPQETPTTWRSSHRLISPRRQNSHFAQYTVESKVTRSPGERELTSAPNAATTVPPPRAPSRSAECAGPRTRRTHARRCRRFRMQPPGSELRPARTPAQPPPPPPTACTQTAPMPSCVQREPHPPNSPNRLNPRYIRNIGREINALWISPARIVSTN